MEPRIVVQFCEDVRHELGGKLSIMGLLGDVVEIEAFPFVFPKLCANFILEIPTSALPKARFTVKMFVNGADRQSMDVPIDLFTAAIEDGKDWVRINGGFDITGFEVKEKTKITVKAILDEHEYSTEFCSILIREKKSDSKVD